MAYDILIVDDEADIREVVFGILQDAGYATRTATNGVECLAAIRVRRPHLIILDVWLNDARYDGISLLEIIKQDHTDIPILMISGHGTIETAVAAIKKGAYDFIEKPFKADRLLLALQRTLEASQLRQENEDLKSRAQDQGLLLGQSQAIIHLRQWVQKVAAGKTRILLNGNVGTGVELVAKQIHRLSGRAQGPLVFINCQTSVEENIDVELFGQEVEKAWGAVDVRAGQLEKAHMGTLVLYEVGALPLAAQARLLKFLQENHFTRMGGKEKVAVDVRVIATTSEDLVEKINSRAFREDLKARLAVMQYTLPKLNQRREDIPELANYFVRRAALLSQLRPLSFSDESMAILQAYDWPGDIAQLRNSVEWGLLNAYCNSSDIITPNFLPPEVNGSLPSMLSPDHIQGIIRFPLREARELFEKYYLTLQLNRFGKNISQTAQFIQMERSALHRKLKSLGIKCEREFDTSAA